MRCPFSLGCDVAYIRGICSLGRVLLLSSRKKGKMISHRSTPSPSLILGFFAYKGVPSFFLGGCSVRMLDWLLSLRV